MPFTTNGSGAQVFVPAGQVVIDNSGQAPGTVTTFTPPASEVSSTLGLPAAVADAALDNLTATAVNQDLVPSGGQSLGSTGNGWATLHCAAWTSTGAMTWTSGGSATVVDSSGSQVALDGAGNLTLSTPDGCSIAMGPSQFDGIEIACPLAGAVTLTEVTLGPIVEIASPNITVSSGVGGQVIVANNTNSAGMQFNDAGSINLNAPTSAGGSTTATLNNVPTAATTPTGYLELVVNGVLSYIPYFQ